MGVIVAVDTDNESRAQRGQVICPEVPSFASKEAVLQPGLSNLEPET